MNKTFFIKTYGCQMNDRDSQAISQDLILAGYNSTQEEKNADIILFNTCSIRDQAERKAFGKIGYMRKIVEKKPQVKIAVVGCMAQSRHKDIIKEFPYVNLIVGTDQLHKIPTLIKNQKDNKQQQVEVDFDPQVIEHLSQHPEGEISAQVSIMRGCNEYCTYCIVPFTRGQEKSRTVISIINEVRALTKKGVREINYLGQNITAYGIIEARKARNYDKEVSPFAELLRETAKIEKIERIRFTSPHARYFNDDLIQTIAQEKKICKGIHFPLQSGSNRILNIMRRRYTTEEFLHWINKLKTAIPDISFSTDIIVGFPGETEEEFLQTRELCEKIGFEQQFIFRYSPRKNTPAAQMPDHLSEEIKKETQPNFTRRFR